jgi:hypothetical protein
MQTRRPRKWLTTKRRRADTKAMSRTLGLPLLLVSLLVGGYLFTRQMSSAGPTAPAVTQAESQAQAAVAATNFQAVQPVLQAAYAAGGTYAGAALPPGSGVVLVRGDATSYCVQTAAGVTPVQHQTGPGGPVALGPC